MDQLLVAEWINNWWPGTPRPGRRTPLNDFLHRHKVIGFVDAATTHPDTKTLCVTWPPQGHWLRGCRDVMDVALLAVLVIRHKVIGFVDAATKYPGNADAILVRSSPPKNHV